MSSKITPVKNLIFAMVLNLHGCKIISVLQTSSFIRHVQYVLFRCFCGYSNLKFEINIFPNVTPSVSDEDSGRTALNTQLI